MPCGTRHRRGEALNTLTPGLIHELHQAAFYLRPDPYAPGEAVPVLALAGFRIAAYFTEDGSLNLEVTGEDAPSIFPRDADDKLAVTVRTDSSISQS
ncbi:hypothetical protein AB0393_29240 [Streptomyces cyaneofuscatus]|uniref:hypothetical protein n=1 Tax=Streptomyces cyaneofuscatus TaxID=66883 RepID=UPI00344D257D